MRTSFKKIITGDETWVHRYDPENKRQSMEYRHKESPQPKIFKTTHQFFKDGFQKLVQRWRKCIEVRGDFVEKNNDAALKIIDVGIFLYLFH